MSISFRSRIVFNAASNWANMFVTAIVGMALVPVILAKVGVTEYGVWALLVYGLSYVAILDSAFSLAINRFVAFYRNEPEQINRYLAASLLILISLAVLILLLAICLSFYLSNIFAAIPPTLAKNAKITFILVGVTLAAQIIQSSFTGVLRGYEYYTRCNFVTIIYNLLRAGLTIGMLSYWTSIIAIQVAYAISTIIATFLMYLVAQKSIHSLRINFKSIKMDTIRELTSYTLHSIARSGSSVVMYSTMVLLVGWKGTASDVTIYDIASKLPGFIRQIMVGTQNVFLPSVSSLWAKKQIETIRKVLARATHFCSIMTLIPSILLFVFAENILRLWLKNSYLPEMAIVMRIWIITVIPGGLFEIWLPVLVGMGYNKGLTIRSVSTSLSAIILAFFLINSHIATSLAPTIALVITLTIGTGLWLPIYGIQKLQMSPAEYFRSGLSQSLLAGAVSVFIICLLSLFLPQESIHWYVRFILVFGIVILLFAVIAMRTEITELVVLLKRKVLKQPSSEEIN